MRLGPEAIQKGETDWRGQNYMDIADYMKALGYDKWVEIAQTSWDRTQPPF